MAIVGEALVRVRVISDRLSNDIRDAVKRAVNESKGDIEHDAEGVGESFNKGTASGIRKNRKTVNDEIRETARRFTADSRGIISRAGEDVGRDFTRSIGNGIRDNDRDVSRQIEGTFRRAIGSGGGGNGLERVGQDAGRNFVRSIESGFQEDVRRVFNLRPGDIDDNLGGGAAGSRVGDNVDRGFRSRFARLRASADQAAQNMAGSLGRNLRNFRDTGGLMGDETHAGFLGRMRSRALTTTNSLRGTFNSIGQRLGRTFGRTLGQNTGNGLRDSITDLERAGNDASEAAHRGIRNNTNRNRARLGSMFNGLGKDLGGHFNLGIGAARMGAGIISILTTAGPGILAAGAAIFTSLVTEIITILGAIGPGLAGAIGVGIAGISSLALTGGLLLAAFKSGVAGIDDLKKSAGELFKQLGTPIAENMLSGFNQAVNTLKGALPQLNGVLAETGRSFGNLAVRIADTVASSANMNRIQGILKTNTGFIDNLGISLSGLTTSFLILFNASKPFIDFIGQAAAQFGNWAASSLAVSEANGSLAAWMDRMLAKFKQLAGAVADFGKGIGDVFSAAAPVSEGLMKSIENTARSFHDWTSDTGNMERMTAFFDKAHTITSKIFDVLGSIFSAGGTAFTNMNIEPLMHVLDTIQNVVGPAIARFFNQIQAGASENFVKAFDNIGTALTKIADSGSFEKVANIISTIILKLTEFAATDIGSTILGIVLPIAIMGGLLTSLLGPVAALGKAFFTLGTFALGGETAMGGLAAAAAPFIAIAAAIVGGFILLYANSEKFRTAISGLLTVLGGAFSSVWDNLAPKIENLWNKIKDLATAIGDFLAPVIDFIGPVIARAISFIGDSIGNALDILGGFIDILVGVFTLDWNRVWEGVKEVFGGVWNQIVNIFETAKSALSFAWDAITGIVYAGGQFLSHFFGSVWDGITSVASTVWNAFTSFLSDRWENIKNIATAVWGGITSFFSTIWDGITSAASTAWNAVTSFLSDRWQNIVNVASAIWGGITSFFSTIWDGIVAGVSTAWTIITNIIMGVIGFGGFILQGILAFGNLLLQIFLAPFRLIWLILKPIWERIWQGLQAFWDLITNIATTVWGALSDFFSTVWDGISSVFTTVWEAITGFLSDRWENIKNIASTVWGAISGFFSGIWDFVSGEFALAWEQITTFLSDRWTNIQNVASTIWAGITAFFSTIWDFVSGVFVAVWDSITSWLSDRWTNIQNVAITVWNAISTFFTDLWNTITTTFHTVVDAIVAFLSERWENTKANVSAIWQTISDFFSNIWNAITNIFHTVVDAVVGWLSARWQDISNTASNIWNGIVGIASSAWNAIVNAVEGVVEPIVGWLQQRWDDITSAISSAWDGLSGIVSGIWNSIKDAIIQPIIDAFAGVTEWVGKITGAITSAWDTVSGIVANINTAVAGAADKIVEANAASAGLNSAIAPATASGGIIRPTPGGQLRRIAEAGKAERVEPLDSKGLSERDYAMIQRLGLGGGGGGDTYVTVKIGEQELTGIVSTQVQKSNSALASGLRSGRR